MKTLRETIDQLDEISRRGFLQGAGAAALGATGMLSKPAEAGWIVVPVPNWAGNRQPSNPALEPTSRTMFGYPAKYEDLTETDKVNLSDLISLMYLAQDVRQTDTYDLALSLVNKINQSFRGLHTEAMLNQSRAKLADVRRSKPEAYFKIQNYFLHPTIKDKIIKSATELADNPKDRNNSTAAIDRSQKAPQQTNQPATKNYSERIAARIKPNILYKGDMSGNYRADVEIKVSPDGEILRNRIIKSSGNPEWDDAVTRAVEKTGRLPLDVDGSIPSTIVVGFSSMDSQELEQRRRENLQRMQQGAGATGPARESVNQGVAEESSSDALAKINELTK